MIFFKIFICIFLSLNIFAAEKYIDSITLTKVKKLIEKEEEVALAYKKYLLAKGQIPDEVQTLVDNNYLPKGFNTINPFGREIKFTSSTSYSTNDSLPDNVEIKTNLFDYYYSNKYRHYTKAPISVNNNKVEINLSTKEKFIYTNREEITTTKNDARNKYYLDTKGVLHWYDTSGNYKFSVDKDLIIDSSVTILNPDGSISTEFSDLMEDKNVTFAGQTILHNKDGVALEYIYLGANVGIVKVNAITRDVGKTIIQFSRRAGGMIVNGDIYTWGNNANKITGIDIKKYTKENGNDGSQYPVITGLVRAKVKTYNSDIDYANYFSSPLRPKFIDFFSTVFHSTCGVTTKGELYCGGLASAYQPGFLYSDVNPSNPKIEMLYKSNYFDGSSDKKATKIFANDAFWLILGNTDTDTDGSYKNGKIYRWGATSYGFAGNNNKSYSSANISELIVTEKSIQVLFKDLTYLLSLGHRKIVALSNEGDIYIWGVDLYNSNNYSCSNSVDSVPYNLCLPTKITTINSTITSSIKFTSIQSSLDGFIAKDENEIYYKISHPLNMKIQVQSIKDIIKSYDKYSSLDDSNILSVDLSRKIAEIGTASTSSSGIVWVNSKNELKGDYYTSENNSDPIFEAAIKKIKWKKIKVIQDDNGMCGIDIYNQMYCWGMMSFYGKDMRDTFMLPVFNTNLFELDKDYLVVEGGNSSLTTITKGAWTNDSEKPFFIKYPTYIGGFNYEFTFK